MKLLQTTVKSLLIVLSLIFSQLSCARETITILWGFSIGSNQANTVRIMCEELNQIQDKYTFVIGHKPGAGGTIAANAVTNSPSNTLLSMSSSFIIRPLFEKNEPTHNLDDFVPVLIQGTGSPLYIVSAKYINIKQLLTANNISIGIAGTGGMSHIVAAEIAKHNKTVNIIFFKSMIDAGTAAAGGHVDAAIGLYADLLPTLESHKVEILGHTGKINILNNRNFLLYQQGMPALQSVTANYAIFASKDMSEQRRLEINWLLSRVQKSSLVIDSLSKDQLIPSALNYAESQTWYSDQRSYWKTQVVKITPIK